MNNELMMTVLSWFVFSLGLLWVLLFIIYKIIPMPATLSQQISCAVWFLKDCKTVVDTDTQATGPAPPDASVLPSRQSVDIQPAKYEVYVQFAGVLARDSVRAMMRKLGEQGWNVQGAEGGGQRTSDATGTSEVRYAAGDKAAAEALAAAVQESHLSSRAVNAIQNSSVEKSKLEVWISR
ncbi:hypothetical protein [Rhizobium sophoriradicis]|uniref:hypothetical protein n=1 Tax=Rhizobium sophoriradicis TaxID=1535245 RepID=UPI0015CA003E|nr:hypothetical protein [Rhizobium sophoriradicis]